MNNLTAFLALALMAAAPLQAEEISSHDNRLYISVGESSNPAQMPVMLHLENPSIDITAVEIYLSVPDGCTLSTGSLDSYRCTASHELTEGVTDTGHFCSIVSPELLSFDNTSGSICSWICDTSSLGNGDYTISACGMLAISIASGETICYTVADQSITFTKTDDMISGIDAVRSDKKELEIYNLQGHRLSNPQPGQINIINGKKIKL